MTKNAEILRDHRSRRRAEGIVRLELSVPMEDSLLLRRAAATLRGGGTGATRLRTELRQLLEPETGQDLFDRLTCEGLDEDLIESLMQRDRDLPRDIEF